MLEYEDHIGNREIFMAYTNILITSIGDTGSSDDHTHVRLCYYPRSPHSSKSSVAMTRVRKRSIIRGFDLSYCVLDGLFY